MSISHAPDPTPPPRQLTAFVNVTDDTEISRSSRRTISAYFAELTVEQAASLCSVLAQVPALIEEARQEHQKQMRAEMKAAFTVPLSAILTLNAQAWAHERWHEEVVNTLACISLDEAEERCDAGPWDLRLDLLVLAHQGRSYVPAFQFDSDGVPAAAWLTLIAVLRGTKSRPSDWDILAWLLRPHPLLSGGAPLDMQATNPQRVRELAYSNSREKLL
jgi:hypothetical protein